MDTSATHSNPSHAPSSEDLKASAVEAAENLRQAAGEKAQSLRDAAGDKATKFRSSAEKRATEFAGFADHTWDDAKQVAGELKAEGEQFIRENPGRAVLTAVGVGFVVGLLFRR